MQACVKKPLLLSLRPCLNSTFPERNSAKIDFSSEGHYSFDICHILSYIFSYYFVYNFYLLSIIYLYLLIIYHLSLSYMLVSYFIYIYSKLGCLMQWLLWILITMRICDVCFVFGQRTCDVCFVWCWGQEQGKEMTVMEALICIPICPMGWVGSFREGAFGARSWGSSFQGDFVKRGAQGYCDNGSPISVKSLHSSGTLRAGGFEYQQLAFGQEHLYAVMGTVSSAKVGSLPLVFRVMGTDMRGLRGEGGNGGCRWKSGFWAARFLRTVSRILWGMRLLTIFPVHIEERIQAGEPAPHATHTPYMSDLLPQLDSRAQDIRGHL